MYTEEGSSPAREQQTHQNERQETSAWQDAILTELAKGKCFQSIKEEDRKLVVKEVIALRDFARTYIFLSNFMYRIVDHQSKNGNSLCNRTDSKYTARSFMKDPFTLLDALIIRTIQVDGAFEELFTFSAMRRKLVVVFGGDRGGKAFSLDSFPPKPGEKHLRMKCFSQSPSCLDLRIIQSDAWSFVWGRIKGCHTLTNESSKSWQEWLALNNEWKLLNDV